MTTTMNNNKTMSELLYTKDELKEIVLSRDKWFRERHSELIRNRQIKQEDNKR